MSEHEMGRLVVGGMDLGGLDPRAFGLVMRWLEDALIARGARIDGAGFGLGQADVDIVLDGHRYNVSLRPLGPAGPS